MSNGLQPRNAFPARRKTLGVDEELYSGPPTRRRSPLVPTTFLTPPGTPTKTGDIRTEVEGDVQYPRIDGVDLVFVYFTRDFD
jgi:hypothetical protein